MLEIYNEDCLEKMKDFEDSSIDMVLCDLPYAVTQAKHDVLIPMTDFVRVNVRNREKLMEQQEYFMYCFKKGLTYKQTIESFNQEKESGLWTFYNRIVKPNGAVVLFGQDKFTSYLMQSNLKNHRYNLIWNKLGQPTGFLNANRQPLRSHEDILVFYQKPPVYNPQKVKGKPNNSRGSSDKPLTNKNYGSMVFVDNHETLGDLKHPRSILSFNKPHPPVFATQKSVELCEWLIKSYTNPQDTVLDNTMGSGSTGIACLNTDRKFIGIEKDKENFEQAKQRLEL